MLDKAIHYKKEFRKQYRRSKSFDRTCRNHGSCSYCRNNRLHKFEVKEQSAKYIMQEDLLELL